MVDKFDNLKGGLHPRIVRVMQSLFLYIVGLVFPL